MLENVLEQIKLKGNYSIQVFYGEDMGCDDIDVPQNERKIKIIASPVGYLGGIRTLINTTLDDLKEFNINNVTYKQISNPPQSHEYRENGAYVWGEFKGVEKFLRGGI